MKKNIIKAVCFTLILVMVTGVANYGLKWKDSLGIRMFYAMPRDAMDVIFFGSSHAEYGVNTTYLWDDYGIAAYSMTEGGQNLGTTYYYMKEALKYQKPQVMVVELTFVAPGWEMAGDYNSFIYRNTINMRYSKNYIDNMNYNIEVAKQDGSWDKNLWKNILFHFPVYHSRYKELTMTDFTKVHPELGRYEGSTHVEPQTIPNCVNITEGCEEGYDGIQRREYVDKMIELCKENDVQLLFWISPYWALDDYMKVYNTMGDYAAEKNVPYLNFCTPKLQEEIGFDYATDMIEYSHVNLDGCYKVTHYLGQYLSEQCGVESRAGDSNYSIYQEISDNWSAKEAELRATGR
ncbi:MAG: hypothetical protein IJK17_05470 [Lachnospiraceae bacterium]|nr:hypothetical protein [Lachnospiraceae bacterium]